MKKKYGKSEAARMPTSLSKWWGSFREMMIPKRQSRRQLFCDAGITLGILVVAAAVCTLLTHMGDSDSAVPMVFMLAVLLVARLTDGFLFSLVATVVSVIGVNYAFTYPYFAFNFTITGYPLTFVTMFAVSIVVGMLTDQVKRQERVKSEAEKEKMKANLLRSVSHDLRTPLTSIIGSSSAVLENYDQFSDEVKKDLIGHVRDDAQWLVRLVENMLSITRFNEGAVQIDKVPQAAEEIAAEAVGKFKKRFNTLPVRVSVPDELLMVPMDATLIEQVLINLMENAVLHAEGATEIELQIRREGDLAQFSVLDNGAGIEPAVLPKLFEEMFPHAGEAARRRAAEHGHRAFGLHEHRAGARRHDESEKSSDGRRMRFVYAADGGGITMAVRGKVLIVEDDRAICSFMRRVLEANGYESIIVGTGREALSMLTSHCPDVVILDLGLPDMDGMDVLTQPAHGR